MSAGFIYISMASRSENYCRYEINPVEQIGTQHTLNPVTMA
jgi:hypothetical protein